MSDNQDDKNPMQDDVVLQLRQLNIGLGEQMLIQQLDLTLRVQCTLGVVGASGSGKTTLMMALLGMLPPQFTVSCQLAKLNTTPLALDKQGDEAVFRAVRDRQIGYIAQEPKDALNPLHTIAQSFDLLFAQAGVAKSARKQSMLQLLTQVKLPNPEQFLQRYPHQISGGEARRISIAQALIFRPRLLIADEPSSSLDAHLRDEILQLLQDVCHQSKAALILISHDLPSIEQRCDEFLLLTNFKHQLGRRTDMLNTPLWRALTVDFGEPTAQAQMTQHAPTVLQIENLSLQYQSARLFTRKPHQPLVHRLNLRLAQGQTLGVIGRSGVGKSTFAKAIMRMDKHIRLTGRIKIAGTDIYQLKSKQLRAFRPTVQLVMQEVRASLNPLRTIQQSLLEAFANESDNQASEQNLARIERLMTLCQLPTSLLARYPEHLSGGECQRVCIVRALLCRPSLLILDEPSAMLDRLATASLVKLLKNIQQTLNLSLIIISHDIELIQAISHQVLHLQSADNHWLQLSSASKNHLS